MPAKPESSGGSNDHSDSRRIRLERSRLKELIEGKKIKVNELASMLGVTPTAVRTWMRGANLPSKSHLPKLLDIFGYETELALLGIAVENDVSPFGRDKKRHHSVSEIEERLSRFKRYEIRSNQLEAIRDFAVRHMGPQIAPLEILKSWMTVNPRIFFGLKEHVEHGLVSTDTVVGYYSIRPLTHEAVQLIEAGELDGATLLPEHLLSPDVMPTALYIGGVAAEEGYARGALMMFLSDDIDRYISNGVKVVYAKPLTNDGMRLLLKYGFVAIRRHQKRGVYRLGSTAR